MGSFLVALPLGLFRGIRMNFDPAYRSDGLKRWTRRRCKFLNARDEVLPLEDGDYEVISMLPKPEWSAVLNSIQRQLVHCVDSGLCSAEQKRSTAIIFMEWQVRISHNRAVYNG